MWHLVKDNAGPIYVVTLSAVWGYDQRQTDTPNTLKMQVIVVILIFSSMLHC